MCVHLPCCLGGVAEPLRQVISLEDGPATRLRSVIPSHSELLLHAQQRQNPPPPPVREELLQLQDCLLKIGRE